MLQPILMRNLDLIDDKMCKIASQDIFSRQFRSQDITYFMFLLVYNFSQKVFKIKLLNFWR